MDTPEIASSDQWMLDGDCEQCRRKKYCKKECKRHRERANQIMYSTVLDSLDKRTGGVMTQMISQSCRT